MFGFRRKKKNNPVTANTFVEATGGGWSDVPDTVAGDGGSHADYVGEVLKRARDYARDNINIGEEFEFTITNIPAGITSPHEIVFGIMMRAQDYGLSPGVVYDETARFTRVS